MLKTTFFKSKSTDILQDDRKKSSSDEYKKSKERRRSKDCDIIKNSLSKSSSKIARIEKIRSEDSLRCPIPEKQQKRIIKVEEEREEKEECKVEENYKREPKIDSSLSLPKINDKYMKFIKIDVDPNGDGEFLRVDWKDIMEGLTLNEQSEFVDEFIRLAYWEINESAVFACAIIENGAKDIEDMFEWLMKDYSNLPVKYGSLTSKQVVHVTKYKDYYEKVLENYSNGTFRYGGLEALSIVGKKKEECGGVFEKYLMCLNKHVVTGPIMPWGKFTISPDMRPIDSNDGPIFWVRPGEQCFTTDDIDGSSKDKRKQKYCGLRRHAKREIHFEDRTPSHADFTKCGLIKDCTGAVGILKAIRSPSDPYMGVNRILKDVVCFPAKYIEDVVQFLDINLSHPPLNQCNIWVDEAKLNQIRRNNIKYVHVSLKENCVYFLPRKVIHQFRTISACSSIAWHARLKQYYKNSNFEIPINHDHTTPKHKHKNLSEK